MPLGVLGGAAIGAIAGGGMTGALLGATLGGAAAQLIGGGPAGPGAGPISTEQLFEQRTVFGEQQGFDQQLQALIRNPSLVTSLPGYQFNLDVGAETAARTGGPAGAGSQATGLVRYGQDYATQAYMNQVQVLSQLAGITAPSSPSQLGAGALGGAQLSSQNINNLLTQMGILGILGKSGVFGSAGTPATLGNLSSAMASMSTMGFGGD